MENPTADELLEMLDNVSAIASNLLAWCACFRDEYPDDMRRRKKVVHEARRLCDKLLRNEDWES